MGEIATETPRSRSIIKQPSPYAQRYLVITPSIDRCAWKGHVERRRRFPFPPKIFKDQHE